MNVRAAALFVLGVAAPLGVYLVIFDLGFVGSIFLGLPLAWQLAIALAIDALGGLLAGLTLVRIWDAALAAMDRQWPRWLRRATPLAWAFLGLAPPFFVFQEKAAVGIAVLVPTFALVGLVWHYHHGRRNTVP